MPSLRVELMKHVPWVKYVPDRGLVCEGFMSKTPLKAVFRMGNRPPVGLDNYRCSKPAHWNFVALEISEAKTGLYCWAHLHSQMYGSQEEARRIDGWFRSRECAKIKSGLING